MPKCAARGKTGSINSDWVKNIHFTNFTRVFNNGQSDQFYKIDPWINEQRAGILFIIAAKPT